MEVKFAVIALKAAVVGGALHVAGAVKSILIVEPKAPPSLDPLTLAFAIEGEGLVEGKHHLRVDIVGPPGEFTLLEGDVNTKKEPDGRVALTERVELAGLTFPVAGEYQIRATVDGKAAGAISIEAGIAKGTLRADFNAFHQERQGIEEGQKYLRGRLFFDLWGSGKGFAGRTSVLIAQPQGGDFTQDPLTIVLPPAYKRLGRSPGFKDAVRKAHDHYVYGMFGGTFPSAGEITLEDNHFVGGGISVEFELAEDPDSGGW